MRSSEYVVRRIAFALATIFVAATLNFVIFRAAPGDATTAMRCLSCTDEVRLQVRQELGLDKSKFQQYVIYLKDLAHGDFGRSFQNRQPVLPQLWQPLKNTLPMLLLGTLFSIVFGLITGVVAAWRRGTLVEKLSVLVRARVLLAADAVARDHADPLRGRAARPADERHQRPVPLVHATRASGPSSPTGSATWCCRRSRSASCSTASTR